MNGRQRIVLVVGLGVACVVAAVTVSRLLSPSGADWFTYAPNTSVYYAISKSAVWRDTAIWAVAVAVWTVASYLIVRGRSDDGE